MKDEIIKILENQLNTHDKRFMFLKLEFPFLVSHIVLEGSAHDTAYNIYYAFEKRDILKDLQRVLFEKLK